MPGPERGNQPRYILLSHFDLMTDLDYEHRFYILEANTLPSRLRQFLMLHMIVICHLSWVFDSILTILVSMYNMCAYICEIQFYCYFLCQGVIKNSFVHVTYTSLDKFAYVLYGEWQYMSIPCHFALPFTLLTIFLRQIPWQFFIALM